MLIKNALIVDDSKSARLVLQRLLARIKVNVDTVESAEAALAFLEHRQPDIIFMDHMMPGMDGLEATSIIRANPKTASIPTIMYTSKDGDEYQRIAQQRGANGVLCKPADQDAVMAVIRALDAPAANDAEKEDPVMPAANIPLVEIDRMVQKHLRVALTEAKGEITAGIDTTASQLQQHQKHQLEIIRRQMQHHIESQRKDVMAELEPAQLFRRTQSLSQQLARTVTEKTMRKTNDELHTEIRMQRAELELLLAEQKSDLEQLVRTKTVRAAIAGASVGILAAVLVSSVI